MSPVRVIFFSIGYCILMILILIIIKIGLFKFLDKKLSFPFFRENYDGSFHIDGLTFQGQALWLFILSFIYSFPLLFLHESNYFGNIGYFLAFFSPGLMLFLRIKTFNDKNILPETGMGYDSMKAWSFSFFCSFIGFMFGFPQIYFYGIISYPTLLVIIASIFAIIPMFPDYINNYLSYDIRSDKGMMFFYKLVFITNIILGGLAFIFSFQ